MHGRGTGTSGVLHQRSLHPAPATRRQPVIGALPLCGLCSHLLEEVVIPAPHGLPLPLLGLQPRWSEGENGGKVAFKFESGEAHTA